MYKKLFTCLIVICASIVYISAGSAEKSKQPATAKKQVKQDTAVLQIKDETKTKDIKSAIPAREPFADFALTSIVDKKIYKLKELKGNVIVLNFFATWCPPCRAEIPDFQKVYDEFKDKKVVFLGLALDDDPQDVLPKFISKYKITYPILLNGKDLSYKYEVRGIPTTYFLDKNNGILQKYVGGISEKTLIENINKLIKEDN